MITPPAEFQTERLRLRFPTVGDADAIFEAYAADPDVTRYMTWVPHKAPATVETYLEEMVRRRQDGAEYTWAVTIPGDDQPVGMIGARVDGHKTDIGYVLAKAYWNQGYMTEVISAVAGWMLSQAEIFRVWAVCDTENIGSARVLEKSGFEREGLLRRWILHPNCSDGPRDCYIYARTR
jgi:ribosomal-protein-alanine N-acetyltransferase